MFKYEAALGKDKIIIETGRLARQADGAVTVQFGGTMVLVTAVCSENPRENIGFFPLTVEYQEKTYAAGKIPGGFFKREGRPSEKAILTARCIDRPIRSLFGKGFLNELQIMAIVLSTDGQNDSDVLAMIGASAALSISNIPFNGPLASVRVGRVANELVINPTFQELENSDLDLVISGKKDRVLMVEAGGKEVSEDVILEAIKFGHKHLKALVELQEKMISECGRPKRTIEPKSVDKALVDKVKQTAQPKMEEINKITDKDKQEEAMGLLTKGLIEELVTEESEYTDKDIKAALEEVEKEQVRRFILDKNQRFDGRKFNEIRKLDCEVGFLPRTHGSGLFTRGQTQSLSVATLGTSHDEQRIDAIEGESHKSFMLHYNFPPFSVGEVRPVRGPGRREIGHGALAEKALKVVMPSKESFPYTVRIVSDILESNGSSSMATVCAGSLSLMDAGVPISRPVGGIAIGLVKEGEKAVILTDIAGVEDHYGDMDFKVAGTVNGVTALQMDLKIEGVGYDVLNEALRMGKEARLVILDAMMKTISKPKESISEFAPRIVTLKISTEKIKDVIGPGGKVIRKIIQDTGATIDIEDDGTVQVASPEAEALEKAVEIIKGITAEAEVGKIYSGKIKRILNFGAFCEILPGKEGLIHVSELADKYVKTVEDVVKVGDEVTVKVIGIDEQGRVNLSRKQAQGNQGEADGKGQDKDKVKKRL
ncbi:polyribonucleotide nucleotidyltransferase [Candidatus Omnitrophota bacterium]